jgi:hypothetical protein
VAVWRGRHIAIGQSITEYRINGRELADQLFGQATFLGLNDRARVPGDQAAECLFGLADIPEIACPVEGMEAGIHQRRRVADVVQPGCGFDQLRVGAKHGSEGAGLRGDTSDMRPPTRERNFEQLACDLFGPLGLIHPIKVTEGHSGRARTRQAVLGTSVTPSAAPACRAWRVGQDRPAILAGGGPIPPLSQILPCAHPL